MAFQTNFLLQAVAIVVIFFPHGSEIDFNGALYTNESQEVRR
jgi:hypothetical protein